MALEHKIEAVNKISQALNQDPVGTNQLAEAEQLAQKQDRFQNFVETASKQSTFHKVEGAFVVAPEGIQQLEKTPVFAEEKVTVQKNGTATDQEQKRGKQHETDEVEAVGKTTQTVNESPSSLMDEVKKLNTRVSSAARLTPEDLRHQAKDLITQIEKVKTQLSQPATEIKPSYQNLLSNRLSHIDDNLKIALSKAGVEYSAPQPTAIGGTSSNPIERFLGFLTKSQYQLEHLNETIDQLNLKKAELTPAAMLTIQMKMGYVQQQIELFTSLLNKALESTKTIMNVQV